MKASVSLVLIFLTVSVCLAQTELDSLRQLVHDAPTSEKRVDYLNDLANILLDYSLDESNQVVEEAIHLSKKINYDYGLGWALIHKGIYYWLAGNPRQALAVQQEANVVANRIQNFGLKAYVKLQNGRVYRDMGYYDSAMANFKKAEVFQKQEPQSRLYALSMIYTALGNQYVLMEEPDSGIPYLQQALQTRMEMKSKALVAYTWIDLGEAYRVKYDLAKAKEYYAKALSLNPKDIWLQASYAESMGLLAYSEGEFENALKNFNIVLKTYEEYKGKHMLAQTMIRIAEVLEERGLFDLAFEYLYRALKIAEESDYYLLAAETHYALAWVSMRAGQLPGARTSIKQARQIFETLGKKLSVGGCYNVIGLIQMKTHQYDSALVSHLKGLEIRKGFKNKVAISSSLFNIGDLYLEWGNEKAALGYLTEGVKMDEELGDQYGISLYHNRLGRVYTQLGEFKKAEPYLRSALELSQKATANDLLRAIYEDYSIFYEKQGNMKQALAYRKLFEQINDSLYNRGSVQSLAAYRSLYELDVKNRAIQLLNKDKQIQEEQLQQRNLILTVVVITSLFLIGLTLLLYFNGQRMKKFNRDITERNEEIQTQSEELTESNQALLRLNSEIERQREEIQAQAEELMVSNTSIAKINEGLEMMVEQRTADLRTAYQELDTFFYRSSHDFRRPLTTLMGLAEVAKLSVKDLNALELFDKVNATAKNLDKMLVKLQSISDVGSHQLVFKDVLLKQLIGNALDPFREMLREKQAQVSIDIKLIKPCVSYPALIKIAIENIVENAIAFGDPFRPLISVRAYREGLSVIVEVEDNGEGIHPEVKDHLFEMFYRGSERSTGNGLGLYIAQKAMEKISGKISFVNNVNKPGATFKILIPDLQP